MLDTNDPALAEQSRDGLLDCAIFGPARNAVRNRSRYRNIIIRPHFLLRDTSKIDISTTLFGKKMEQPIFICPTGAQKMFHPDGELATARATKAKGTLQILSTVTSNSVESVLKARGGPIWFQLYAPAKWEQAEYMVKRVEAAGCPALALTVDILAGRNTETYRRARRADTRQCSDCHDGE